MYREGAVAETRLASYTMCPYLFWWWWWCCCCHEPLHTLLLSLASSRFCLRQVCVGLCFDWTMRLIGPFLLLLATGLISGVIGMYFKYILPTAAAFGSISVRFWSRFYCDDADYQLP